MSDRLIVVSTDCHAGLPIADYKPYVESKYHQMMDMAVPVTIEMMEQAESTFLIKEINDAWRAPIKQQLTGAWDYKERLNMLTGDGIAAEVIFPTVLPRRTRHRLVPVWGCRPGIWFPNCSGLGPWRITAGWPNGVPMTRAPHWRGLNSPSVGCRASGGSGALVC